MRVLDRLGVQYEFQSKMFGGREVKGGAVADFIIPSLNLVINIQGEYWHYGNPSTEVRDQLQAQAYVSAGYTYIRIDAEAALSNASFYVSEALRGVDHSRKAR